MNIIIGIITVIVITIAIGLILQKKEKAISFKEVVRNTFPKYIIREKNNQIMICEYNHRNEPEEKIFIRIGNVKKIEKKSNFIVANYPTEPSGKELKKDLGKYL